MFAWLPIVGPIVEGIVSIFNKRADVSLGKHQVDGQVHVKEIEESTKTVLAFKDDLGVRLSRDIVMFPGSVWCGLYMWDKIVDHKYPWLVWNVAPLDGPLVSLPFALLTFYFGLTAMNIWKR